MDGDQAIQGFGATSVPEGEPEIECRMPNRRD